MSALALVFLVLTAFTVHHYVDAVDLVGRGWALGWVFFLLWMAILVEALLGYWNTGDYSWKASRRLLLLWLIPPYRLAVTTHPLGACVWLPVLGWQAVDRTSYENLDRAFGIPMLFIAFMILPILAVELFWWEYVNLYPGLKLFLDLGTATIWFAFTVEFIVMSALAENKLFYIAKHWINLLIILVPFLAFMRGLQFMRLLRLGKFGKALKVYRLRGLGLRAWQGMVALGLMERIMLRDSKARLRHLQGQVEEKERQLSILKKRVQAMEEELAARKEAK